MLLSTHCLALTDPAGFQTGPRKEREGQETRYVRSSMVYMMWDRYAEPDWGCGVFFPSAPCVACSVQSTVFKTHKLGVQIAGDTVDRLCPFCWSPTWPPLFHCIHFHTAYPDLWSALLGLFFSTMSAHAMTAFSTDFWSEDPRCIVDPSGLTCKVLCPISAMCREILPVSLKIEI